MKIGSEIGKNRVPATATVISWAAALGVGLYLFSPAVLSGKTFYFRDVHRFFVPMKFALARALQEGSLPLWRNDIYCGSPLAGDIMTGVFYPPSWLFGLSSFPVAFNAFVLLHLAVAYALFFDFIRSLGRSRQAAGVTALSYVFGGYALSSLNLLNHLTTLAWIPGVLGAWVRLERSGRAAGIFPVALFFSLGILGGAPQLMGFAGGILALRAAFLSRSGARLRRTGALAAVALLAVSICSVQLAATYTDYTLSLRRPGVTLEEAVRHSLSWEMLVHLLVPLRFPADFVQMPNAASLFPGGGSIPWLLTIYPGMMMAPLALSALVPRPSRSSLFWFLLLAGSIVLALGENTPAYRFFHMAFPGFRFPEKFLYPAGLSLLVLAADGWDRLCCRFSGGALPSEPLFLVGLSLLALDLCLAHRHMTPFCDPAFYRYRSETVQALPEEGKPYRIYSAAGEASISQGPSSIRETHIRWQRWLRPNLGGVHGVHHVDGVSGMELIHQFFITEALGRPWEEKIHFLQTTNTRFVLSEQPLEFAGVGDAVEKRGSGLYRVRNPMPRSWLTTRVLPLEQDVVAGLNADTAAHGTVHGPPHLARRWSEPGWTPAASVAYETNRIRLETAYDRPAVLFVSEAYHPGWRVFVDGREEKCLRLHYLFMGVELETGRHRVHFVFRPPHFVAWTSVTAGALLLFVSVWCAIWYREGAKWKVIKKGK